MTLGLWLQALWREIRGARGRNGFFVACIAVGVAAVVGVEALVDAIERGVRARSRALLGGDLALESRRPLPQPDTYLPPELRDAPRVSLSIFSTMVRTEEGSSALAELKAVDASQGRFPLAGSLVVEPVRPLHELLDARSVLLAPELLGQLRARIGDALYVGDERLRITGVIHQEPDPVAFSFSFGPRVLIAQEALVRTGLLAVGSRVRYRTLLDLGKDLSEPELARVKRTLEQRVPGGGTYVSVETHSEAQPALRSVLARVRRYLGLVALLSLLIGGVGVAQLVSAMLAGAIPRTAILRCLGFRPREVAALYLGHVTALALAGSLLGAAVGRSLPALVGELHPRLLPPESLTALPLASLVKGVALGVGIPVLFSLPALTSVWRVSPASVLRSGALPLPVPPRLRRLAVALCALALAGATWLQSRDLRLTLAFSAGTAVLAALLCVAARGLAACVARLPRARLPPLLWHGAAALARPGAGTTGSIVTLGLGTLVVLGIALVQDVLGRELDTALPPDAPSVFMLDVQPDQWPAVAQLAEELGAARIESVPVVTARLLAVDGRPVEQLVKQRPGERNERGRAQWVLTREQRITWMSALPSDNRIVEGSLFRDPAADEVSVEVGFARDLGAKLGSTLRFDVQGVPVDLKVTSLRTVTWRSFSMNFFLVVEPGVLDDAPHFRLGALRIPEAREQELQDRLAARFPNVTMLRVHALLDRALALIEQLALAVTLLGSFAALTGLVVLLGATVAAQLRRGREVALLKTLGLTRAEVVGLFAVEYALAGALAGVLGSLGAYALVASFTRSVLELSTMPSLRVCVLAWLATTGLSVLGGLGASTRALRTHPLESLRRRS